MNTEIKILERKIGQTHPPFIIAELSGNHNGSLERCLELVDAAAESGADAIKLQTYTADTITLNCDSKDFRIDNAESLWNGRRLYDLYHEAHTPWEWHEAIFDRCQAKGLLYLSTPFDETAVDFLEELDVPSYKIASFENNHFPLIKKIARMGKPMIISTGMAEHSELVDMLKVIRSEGNEQIILLVCTSAYPAKAEDANLATIAHMRESFNVQVGISDHTMGSVVPVVGVALGATVIEKHFTLNRNDGGVDSAFSMEPQDLRELVKVSKTAWKSVGKIHYGPTANEKASIQFRRSIYVAEDVQEGDVFNTSNLRVVRPGFGLHPKHFEHILGKRCVQSIQQGTPLSWELVSEKER